MLRKPMFRQTLIYVIPFFLFACQTKSTLTLQGAWKPEIYLLKNGSELQVDGQIFFTESDWTVLFFVLDGNNFPKKGSGEGGTYTLNDNKLVFKHNYHLSGGHSVGSLPASPLKMEINKTVDAATESCTIELSQNKLTIHFPSGNTMTFKRNSGFQK